MRIWSGEIFWNDEWNRDIAFQDAFRTSCVWYFREIVDEIGPDRMQTELEKLEYGNCDISDWEGKLNQNNRNRAGRIFLFTGKPGRAWNMVLL